MVDTARQAVLESDPFYSAEDTHLYLTSHPEDHTVELNPEIITNIAVPPPPPVEEAPVAAAPVVEPEKDEPQVYEYEDGSSVVIEKTKKGWKAVADSGTGKPAEVFYGTTKDELLHNVLVGKLNATKKIQEQARKIKLGEFDQPPAQPQSVAPVISTQELSADDIFTIKAQLEDNPALAMNTAFQKMTGLTMQQLVGMAQAGQSAQNELYRDQIGREFKEANPDYFAVNQNYWAMVKWLAKYKLGKQMTDQNELQLLDELVQKRLYTVRSLTEAYEDLKENDLLIAAPVQQVVEEEEEAPPAAPAVVAAPATPARRPRAAAALGIRSGGAAPPKAVVQEAPKRIEDMSPEEVSAAIAEVRKFKMRNPAAYAEAQAQAQQGRR